MATTSIDLLPPSTPTSPQRTYRLDLALQALGDVLADIALSAASRQKESAARNDSPGVGLRRRGQATSGPASSRTTRPRGATGPTSTAGVTDR